MAALNDLFPVPAKLLKIESEADFQTKCLEVFQHQHSANKVYKEFCHLLNAGSELRDFAKIPFLPVEFFKTHAIVCGTAKPEIIFASSGTTGQAVSKHFVTEPEVYRQSLVRAFEMSYGPAANYCFLALLPSYLEREGSSLIFMVEKLMEMSAHADNGFYLYDHDKLATAIERLIVSKQPTLLIGVSYALLDFSEKYPISLPDHFIVMETGGMKGRKKEIVREELHKTLRRRFRTQTIHSEYGMTELLSQAYSKGNGLFKSPPWMRVLIRDMHNPFRFLPPGKTGGVNIIDLANVNSCSFIATQDLGRVHEDGSFEILGRFDVSDVRGCNLMIS